MAVKKAETTGLEIHPLKSGEITVRLIGRTPFYYNAMSAKAKRDLLLGGGRKTAAQKKELKHNPPEEFRDSVYKIADGPTLLAFPGAGVKGAIATAALETAGITKTSVNRLIFLPQARISIWGKPRLKMDVVRSADMNKTPDIRTRAYLREWCSEVTLRYIDPTLSYMSILSLLVNAGMIVGLGDFRQEKGKGAFGTFAVAGCDDAEMGEHAEAWTAATAYGRAEQIAALEEAEPEDEETAELLEIYQEEYNRRNFRVAA
jgi:hypothetical protein